MKLTKLLLLAPAFMMLACTKAPANSSSKEDTPVGPETTVSAETWDAQVNWADFLKPGQNRTITTSHIDLNGIEETQIVWTEMD